MPVDMKAKQMPKTSYESKDAGEQTDLSVKRAQAVLARLAECLAELEAIGMLTTAANICTAMDTLREEMADLAA